MHQWEIHNEDVLLNMFMFSLAGDAREWYHSLPPARISSLEQFHVAFNKHYQKYYSFEFICHNCCEEYKDYIQDMVVSNESGEDEGCEEEKDAFGELMELVESLSSEIERLESEQSTEDSPVFEKDDLDNPTDGDSIKYFITVEALYYALDLPVVSDLNEEIMVYLDEKK
jgi:hypothetical protein